MITFGNFWMIIEQFETKIESLLLKLNLNLSSFKILSMKRSAMVLFSYFVAFYLINYAFNTIIWMNGSNYSN